MSDHAQEQEMEIEALQSILMDDIKEIDPSESGLSTNSRCFQISLSPQGDDLDEANYTPVQLALIFSHTEKYPDEPPLLNVKSIRGIKPEDLKVLKEKLDQEIIVPHGDAVTVETFVAWRDRFEAELALERAKLMPESALTAPKEKKLTGRQWFESGRAAVKGAAAAAEGSDEEEEEDIEFDDDFEDDEDDMLEHYLAEKSSEGSMK